MVYNYSTTYTHGTNTGVFSNTYAGVRRSVQWQGNNCSSTIGGRQNYRGLPRAIQGSDGKRYYKWSTASVDK